MVSLADDSRLSVIIQGTKEELEIWQTNLTDGLQALGAKVKSSISAGKDAKGRGKRGKLHIRGKGKGPGGDKKTSTAGKGNIKGKGQSQEAFGPPPQRGGKKRHAKEQRFKGVVKGFNEKRGYFFVDCPDIFGTYQCDVVLLAGDCAKAQAGSTIEFAAVEAEGYKNPVAQRVRLTM
eukprot:GEMP01070339.1.p1 GENE.GEMP01070339.1~~GEMP01070339.1.p1  ORF type:complete len:177 (-),score=51.77 GEMP01070339.1:643-1173(-)